MAMMTDDDKDRFFQTFQSIIDSVIKEKRQTEKWQKKLKQFKGNVQLKLRISKDEYYYCHLHAKDGEFELYAGEDPEGYDLELAATPEDLMNFTNRTYSTLDMILKKNQYGETRLKVKKGGRNLGKLLAVSKLLVLD
jgi:hypothetical protein